MRRYVMMLLCLAACGHDPSAPPPLPENGEIAPGTSWSLAALVASQAGGLAVAWTVEPGGGTIDQAGLYSAPGCTQLLAAAGPLAPGSGQITGTEHVTATWAGGSQVITITVAEAVLAVEVAPTSVETTAGGTVQFHATVHYSCHDQVT